MGPGTGSDTGVRPGGSRARSTSNVLDCASITFGLARYSEGATGTLTHKGYGSVPYIAPELWRGESATSMSDYALGVVAYEMVTGSLPFTGTDDKVRNGHLKVPPPPTGAPSRIDWAILDCLKKIPSLRPAAEQFNDKLQPSAAADYAEPIRKAWGSWRNAPTNPPVLNQQ